MPTSLDAIINRQLLKWEFEQKNTLPAETSENKILPIVTVSRQTGSRGSYFASRLAERLQYTYIHREIIDRICTSSGFRKRVIASIDENFRSDLDLMVESIITGQTVDHYDYIKHLCQIVLSMSKLGGIVLMGRGGNFILGPKRGFHIRFVANKKKRISNLMTYRQISEKDATKMIETSDKQRELFIRKVFNADINDNSCYDLVINGTFMDVEDLLCVVTSAVTCKFQKLKYLHNETE